MRYTCIHIYVYISKVKVFRLNRSCYRSTSCTSATIERNYAFYSTPRTLINVLLRARVCVRASIYNIRINKKMQKRGACIWRYPSMWPVSLNQAISVNCLAGAWRKKRKKKKKKRNSGLTRYSHGAVLIPRFHNEKFRWYLRCIYSGTAIRLEALNWTLGHERLHAGKRSARIRCTRTCTFVSTAQSADWEE